ncbi:hypothetical protein NDU88_005820 [Pleurodeles waltl]|uniref:Uncharacterized protein n=1 Tax=Pleurodeles waltl TaxID=8319 RepID=A0AAV7MCD0_PLEWA|nr:hypothetical protein NDU88_005820 [Pleurodeles waltl]
MCRPDLDDFDFPSRRSGESAQAHQIASPGALWRRAALELRRLRRAIAQTPLWGEAGRASTGPKAPLGGCRKERRGNGVLEGPEKSSGAQLGWPLLGNKWSGAQP